MDGKVLVAKAKGASNTFLPGGHIEFGEKAEDALRREIFEEMGLVIDSTTFLGAIEHKFEDAEHLNLEIALVFRASISDLDPKDKPISLESHLEFFWLKPDELVRANLKPAPLIELISCLDEKSGAFWGSTI
ncbi:NUDIX domain-containing protein [Psychromonas sp. KJ10-10]|uniref:NUDIX domain-containing protein n=1 Tax=Psychromonas sp. KJ10-10 TaxID=3391823 RepID=UPI0039B68239